MGYLWTWALQLHGRSGFGAHGINPLSYGTIADWSRLTGHDPAPHEVEALLVIDAAMQYHEPTTTAKEPEAVTPTPAWPKRKGAG